MRALELRPFRFKAPKVKFLCPLCRSERALSHDFRLRPKHYLQAALTTLATLPLLYPLMSLDGLFVFFLYLPLFEFIRRAKYREEIPCPYCGFDAVWYKKDVNMAKELVRRFWEPRPKKSNS